MLKFTIALLFAQVLLAAPVPQDDGPEFKQGSSSLYLNILDTYAKYTYYNIFDCL